MRNRLTKLGKLHRTWIKARGRSTGPRTTSKPGADLGGQLTGIISKYIGETQENLDRVFVAARAANCILFFDDADALFGKRSEVKDALDRYTKFQARPARRKPDVAAGIDSSYVHVSAIKRQMKRLEARAFVCAAPLPSQYDLWCWKTDRGDFQCVTRMIGEL